MSRWAARLLVGAALLALCLGALRVTRQGRAQRVFARCEARLGTHAWRAVCDRTGLYLHCRCEPWVPGKALPGGQRLPPLDRRCPPERNWWDARESTRFPVKHALRQVGAPVRIRGPPRQC